MTNFIKSFVLILGISIIFVLILYGIAAGISNESNVERTCLSHGYPRYVISKPVSYCVKTVNGSDVVISIKELEDK